MFKIKQRLVLWLTASSLFSGEILAAENKFYVQFNAGAAFAQSFNFSQESRICDFFSCFNSSYHYKEKYDPGFIGSIAFGYKIADQFRIEGEGLFQSNDMDKAVWSYTSSYFSDGGSYALKGERERIAFLLNGYFDFKNSTPFTPYITAGMGGYHMRLKYQSQSYENDLDFAWQAGAGVNYALNDQISFDLKYRYFGGSDAEIQLPGNTISNLTRTQLFEVGDHQVMAGVRVGF